MTDTGKAPTALVEVEGVDKRYPGTQALRSVSVGFNRGEIHALLGANGAGKSTLAKVIAGVESIDAGEIRFDGQSIVGLGAAAVARRGIATIFQQLMLYPPLTVAENLALLRDGYPRRRGLISRRALHRRAAADLALVDRAEIDPGAAVAELRLADAWIVSIAAALARQPKLLILDESTAALPEAEAASIFEFLRERRDAGLGIVLVTHRVEEVERMADRITVLKDGAIAGQAGGEGDRRRIVGLMFGEEIAERLGEGVASGEAAGEPLVEFRNVHSDRLRGLDLTLRRGEVLGIAGAVGSGRSEIVRVLTGQSPIRSGEVLLRGEPYRPSGPRAAIRAGIGAVPEDRDQQGILHGLSLKENITVASLDSLRRGPTPLLDRRRERASAAAQVERLAIKGRLGERIEGLSGGTRQKALIARSLLLGADLLVLDEPTVGVDLPTRLDLRAILHELAAEGKAVVEISTEFDDLIRDCTRIAVLRDGVAAAADAPFEEAAIAGLAYGAEAA